MKRLFIICAMAMGVVTFAEQPDKWVRYVEATGSQYVDTGIKGRWNTKAECKVEWMEFSDASFLASRSKVWPENGRLYFCYCLNSDGVMYMAQDGGENVNWWNDGETWTCRFETNRVYNYVSEFTATNGVGHATNKIKIDGIDVKSKESAGVDTGYSLYIFANNQKNSVSAPSKTRCYGLKIWQGPVDGGDMTLVRDFQPCMKNGRAGLYDAVSETIFYSGSGTDLVCDENSEVPDAFIDYVEAQGVDAEFSGQNPAYVDTGVIGRSGTKMSGEFAILSNEDKGFLGSRDNSKGDSLCRFYLLQSYYSKITCGYGSHKDNSTTLELGKKYWVETELNAGSQIEKIGADGVTNTVFSASDATAIDTGYPMYLFCCNVNGSPTWFAKARCYGFKLWQDGALVRDFRPCLKNGVAGLYDNVTKRIFYSSGIPLNYDNVYRKSVKPKEVVFVEYIESDGNNTFDTGVPARSGTRAKGEMAWADMRAWNHEMYRYLEYTGSPDVFFRQQRSYLASVSKWDTRFFMVHSYDTKLQMAYGGSGMITPKVNGGDIALTAGAKHSFDVTLANESQTFEWDGEAVMSTNVTGSVDTGNTIHLFSSSYWRFRSAARCYGLQLWQDGILVRDFRPCLMDGKGMLYDRVTKSVYRPSPDIPVSRTGAVVLSGEEKPAQYVEYVESDGTVFVDTGVRGRSGTKADLKMAFLHNADSSFLDARNDNLDDNLYRRFYLWHNYTSASANNMGFGYGSWNQLNGTFSANTVYHVVSSLSAGAQAVSVDGVSYSNTANNMARAQIVDTELDLYLFGCNRNGAPVYPSKSRLYWLKLYQGDTDGGNMQLVRDFKPVKLSNGLVVLWDFKNNEPYLPLSATAPYNYTTFPVVGPDGDLIRVCTRLIIR